MIRSRLLTVIILAMFTVFTLTGCVADPNASNMQKGAATGAGMGAVAGALWGLSTGKTENIVKGALIGAAAGAVIGGLVGLTMDYKERQKQDYAQTKRRINYNPKQGTVVKIESLTAKQQIVKPDSHVELQGDYYVMAPDEKMDISIERLNKIEYYNPETKKYEYMYDKVDTEVKKLGTNTFENKIYLPKETLDGNYRYIIQITAKDKSDQKELPFSVVTKQGQKYIIFHQHLAQNN